MARRRYKVLTAAEWDQAAEEHSRGDDYNVLADRWGVSMRTVATHLPAALERRRVALAPSTTSAEPSLVATSIPDVADREEATRHWRQAAWADSQTLQTRLREEIAAPAPDARAIRALSAGADALKILIAIGRNILEVDHHAADEVLPELIIRELTPEEVTAIRNQHHREDPLAAVEDMFSLEAPEEAECHDVIVENE